MINSRNLIYTNILDLTSKHPIDHIKEQTLQNDPIIKLKKNILVASQEQLQQVTKQTKQSLQKQIFKKDNEWEP